MKRILFLLLLTVSVYGQNPSRFAKIQITGNTTSGTATKVNVQEANGDVNTQAINSGFNKNIGLGSGDVVGATTLLNQYSATPSDWTAQTYTLGSVVFYGGKQWLSKSATVAGDVPSVSSKWEEMTFESLANKTITVDAIPTDGSDNAVSSNGVFDALATKAPISSVHNPVTIGTANGLSLSNQVLSLGLASSTNAGALSSADWNEFKNKQSALTNPVTGTGTTNFLSKWTATGVQGNSQIFDNGTNVGLGTSTPSAKFHIVDTNGGTFFDGTNATYNRWKSTDIIPSLAKDLLISAQTSGNTPDLYINTSGIVLLGSTSGNITDKLQITGSAIATSWKTNGGTTAQYVTGTGSLINFDSSVRTTPLTGFVSGAGTVSATDTVLQAIQKLNGNDALKAPLASPALTGTPTAPTAAAGTNTTQVATTAFVFANTNANAVLLTGNQNIQGVKFFNWALGSPESRIITNNGSSTAGTFSLSMTSVNAGGMINLSNGSNQPALTIQNTSSSSNGILLNGATSSLGNLITGQNNGTNTFTVTKEGDITANSLKFNALNTAPASATATGTQGEIRVTATHIYVCTATNTWVRSSLTTW